MALFNEILEGRYSLQLAKLLNMKGGPPAPQLSGDISAGLTLESDAPEWYALTGGRLCVGYAGQAAGGVGFRTQLVLNNPTSSNLVVRVEQIIVATTVATFAWNIRTNINLAGFATSANVGTRDTRLQQTPAAGLRTKNSAAAVGTVRGVIFPDAVGAAVWAGRCDQPWVLGPGDSVGIDPGADNIDMSGVFYWRERAASPAELALGA